MDYTAAEDEAMCHASYEFFAEPASVHAAFHCKTARSDLIADARVRDRCKCMICVGRERSLEARTDAMVTWEHGRVGYAPVADEPECMFLLFLF